MVSGRRAHDIAPPAAAQSYAPSSNEARQCERPDAPRLGTEARSSALFREMRSEGKWPLLLNIDRREVANLVPPGGQIARRLAVSPPASGDRVLHLVPSRLDECRLCRDGIATPAVDSNVLAAPRRQHDECAAALAARQQPAAIPPSCRRHTRPVSTLIDIELRRALEASGATTTFATLVTALGLQYDADEERLRELLYDLRLEGAINFDRPLARFSAIRIPPQERA